MFKITSTRPITWPGLALANGENVFPSRKSVPAELWPKLARFRALGLMSFELEFDKAGQPVGEDAGIVLEELTEQQLFQMSKAELAELAKANGISLPEDAKKNVLLEALVAKLPKPVKAGESSPALADAAPDAGAPKHHGKRGAPPVSPVTVG